ncbi:hypothetical protein L6164_035806 [Bauhinia variegata]|uniref:Uncharacterized protein n=1 Tax=Bauhinia variegata TaxID=167791 RepID=A0ACB9KF84_BAUVA|nr:hypothetical protein L6164_035806 [Bauhinia variegata]
MNTPAKQYPEFFKVFLPEKSCERMLIPDAFVKRLSGRKLPEKAILKGQSGRVWHVCVRNIQGHMSFDSGWKKFLKANSLKAADFLVFKYDGGDTFMVKIYDKSGCVKKMIKEEEEEEDDDDDDEDFDDRNVEEVDDEDEDFEEVYVKEKEKEKEKEGSGKMKTPHRCKSPRRILPCNAEEYGIDVKKCVQPKNPYFITTLKKSTRKNDLHIPRIVGDYNLSLPEKITLQGPIYDTIGKVKTWQDGRVYINGWRSFCYLNKITGNDICICEFMLETKTMKVHVVPGPV